MGKNKKRASKIEAKEEEKEIVVEGVDEIIESETNQVEETNNVENDEPSNDFFGFEILGGKTAPTEKKVAEKLIPAWMKERKSINNTAIPLDEEHCKYIDSEIIENLKDNCKITSLFPVQAQLIPIILKRKPFGGDTCVCAPTGSGKTLTYVIPIVQALKSRVVVRLRALVLLPSRDLVKQVKEVFDQVAEGTGLSIAAITGQGSSFKHEQEILVRSTPSVNDQSARCTGMSKIDILISTPGRLMDHLEATEGFTLQHLQYLVIDEADRLMQDAYQDWITKVLDASHSAANQGDNQDLFDLDVATKRSLTNHRFSIREEPLLKLLFSATLTQNPSKLASLKLNNPQFYAAAVEGVQFKMPDTLSQFMVITDQSTKPLSLVLLMRAIKFQSAICFAASVESTHRLYLLMKEFFGGEVAEFSGALNQQTRNQILEDFKQSKIKLLICSDVMSRGLDIYDVGCVINYDVPSYIRTYVHRCGRTARAGREGTAYTILRKDQIRHFKQILQKVEGGNVKEYQQDKEKIKESIPEYKEALQKLKKVIDHERKTKNQVVVPDRVGHKNKKQKISEKDSQPVRHQKEANPEKGNNKADHKEKKNNSNNHENSGKKNDKSNYDSGFASRQNNRTNKRHISFNDDD